MQGKYIQFSTGDDGVPRQTTQKFKSVCGINCKTLTNSYSSISVYDLPMNLTETNKSQMLQSFVSSSSNCKILKYCYQIF